MSQLTRAHDGGFGSDLEGDEDERRHRNRERNKEHARKTRVRKKEQLQALKARVNFLEEEGRVLKLGIQECTVASILLGLSSGTTGGTDQHCGEEISQVSSSPSSSNFTASLVEGKRKRFMSLDGEDPTPPPMELNIKGQITLVGGPPGNEGKTQVNWKTGVYVDENGTRQQLTKSELDALRRERNRMHAKMTRDRKKCFIASLKRVISKLEDENEKLRETLERSRTDQNAQPSGEKESGDASSSLHCMRAKENNASSSMIKNPQSTFDSNLYTVG